jgi:hypothetical protein
MVNIVGRLQSSFPSHQLDVIIGSLLGDACLECRSIGLRSPITARFRVHHGERQKEYVFWKYEVLQDLVLKAPREISWKNPKRNLREVSWYFHTRSLKEFGILHDCFYKNGAKILPEEIFDLFTPQMMAVWFMDDGANTVQSFTLSTHSFQESEQNIIRTFLKERYGILATTIKDRSKQKIYIGRNDYEKFTAIIQPYIIPSMIYKIDSPRNDLIGKTIGMQG